MIPRPARRPIDRPERLELWRRAPVLPLRHGSWRYISQSRSVPGGQSVGGATAVSSRNPSHSVSGPRCRQPDAPARGQRSRGASASRPSAWGSRNQAVGRHPLPSGPQAAVILGADLAGRQVGQSNCRARAAAGHHRREAVRQADRMGDEDWPLPASIAETWMKACLSASRAVEQPEPIVSNTRAWRQWFMPGGR